jgi:aerobic carbon-monoxide dehydrogenase large subunit
MASEVLERHEAAQEGKVGDRAPRKEDDRLLRGDGRYTDDLDPGNAIHMAVGRCPFPHARIVSIDVSAAIALEGVHHVLVGSEVRRLAEPLSVLRPVPGVPPLYNEAMAVDVARYEGQPVFSVAAVSRYVAEDALELIDVEYEPLPHVVNVESAVSDAAPVLHEHVGSNVLSSTDTHTGDVQGAFAAAEVAVRGVFHINRVTPLPMEGRAIVAHWRAGAHQLEVTTSTQSPHMVRKQLAECLRLDEADVRVSAPDVGGAFGQKLGAFPEEVLACVHSIRLRRPVKWTEDRMEHFRGSTHGRESRHDAGLAFSADGTLTAMRNVHELDMGAFHSPFGPAVNTINNFTGPYRVANYFGTRRVVATNKMPVGAYRGYSQPESVFVHERLMDMAARRLGIDPLELRVRNLYRADELPETTPGGMQLDSGDYETCLRMAAERIAWSERPQGTGRRREDGRLMGYGLGTYIERTGYPHSRFLADRGSQYGAHEAVTLRATRTGGIEIHTGLSSFGQSAETSLAQICSQVLGIDYERVRVNAGDTGASPFSPGAFASRGLISGGGAMVEAAARLQRKTLRIAGFLLGREDLDRLEIRGGEVYDRDDAEPLITLAEVHEAAILGHRLPENEEPGLEVTAYVEPRGSAYAYGTAAAVVSVDPRTGRFDLERFVLVHDCGTPVNPMLIEGQVHGGVAQALGAAMYEELLYDPDTGQLVNGSMLDYFVPTASDLPEFELDHTTVPSPLTPFGLRGVGEAGTIPPAAAVANAVCDALADFGVELYRLPVTPEAVWRAIQDAQKAGGSSEGH